VRHFFSGPICQQQNRRDGLPGTLKLQNMLNE